MDRLVCPSCGARPGVCLQTAYDDQDRMIRLRRCRTCDEKYATVEIPVPGSFYDFADSYRYNQTVRARLNRGYHAMPQGRYRRGRPRLEVRVRVRPTVSA